MAAEDTAIEVRFSEAIVDPETASDFFSVLASLPAQQIAIMNQWLTEEHLTLSSKDNEVSLAERFGNTVTSETVERLVACFFRLESTRRALQWSPDMFIGYLAGLGVEKAEGKPTLDKQIRDQLVSLFKPKSQVDLLYKARRIYDGCLPSFANCFTTVDFRPVFSDDKNLSIHHGLISTILEIVVRNPDETAGTQRIAVQIDMEDIKRLEKVLDRAKMKIQRVRALTEEKDIRLLNPRIGLNGEDQQ